MTNVKEKFENFKNYERLRNYESKVKRRFETQQEMREQFERHKIITLAQDNSLFPTINDYLRKSKN
jgi:hypothetical protein